MKSSRRIALLAGASLLGSCLFAFAIWLGERGDGGWAIFLMWLVASAVSPSIELFMQRDPWIRMARHVAISFSLGLYTSLVLLDWTMATW